MTYIPTSQIVTLVAIVAVALLLTIRLGRRMGLKLMYVIAALPGVVVVQASCCGCYLDSLQWTVLSAGLCTTDSSLSCMLQIVVLIWGGTVGLYFAAPVFCALYIRCAGVLLMMAQMYTYACSAQGWLHRGTSLTA